MLAALLNCCANHTAPPALPVSSSPACSPTREDRVGVCMGIFQHDAVDRSEVETLVDAFPGQSIDFFGALRARVYDDKVRGAEVAVRWALWHVQRALRLALAAGRLCRWQLLPLTAGRCLAAHPVHSPTRPPLSHCPSGRPPPCCRCTSGSRAPAWRTLARS